MKYTCNKCDKETEVTSYTNRMALEAGECEACWYYEHWRPYKLWIGEQGFVPHGWAEVDPPDHLTIYYEEIVKTNYEKLDWRGNPTHDVTPVRNETHWLQEDEKTIAKQLSEEYKTVVLVQGERPEERKKTFCIAYNGQLFMPVTEDGESTE